MNKNSNNVAKKYLSSGLAKYKNKDYKRAIDDYDKAIELNSVFTEAYYRRGQAKNNILDFKGVIDDYSKALDLDPTGSFADVNEDIYY